MSKLRMTVIAAVAALGILFVGTAVAQDDPSSSSPLLPYPTQEECEANGGTWEWDFCVDPVKREELNSQQPPAAPAPTVATPPATQAEVASDLQPRYTG